MAELVLREAIERRILVIREHRVMLDRDLAELYGVMTSQLTRQVRRNIDRFPDDFMFQLTKEELMNLMCQIGTSSWGGTRKLPYAFTEQGVAMLSSVLRSKRAIHVNIIIMRAFVKIRQFLSTHKELARKLEELEKKTAKHDTEIRDIFDAIKQLMTSPKPKRKPQIGFRPDPKW